MKKLLYLRLIALTATGLSASPYAPIEVLNSSLGDLTYRYNTMGQRLGYDSADTEASQSIEWGLSDKPVKIMTTNTDGQSSTEEFHYGPGGQRYMREHADGSKTIYLGSMEYRIDADGDAKSIVYINNGGYSPIAKVDTSESSPAYEYFLQDHLGSTLMTVRDNGNVMGAKSHGRHDPWGQPWDAEGVAADELNEGSRGFIGHENIASAGLIHMNGRVYDPMIGQFTGPDRFTQNASAGVGLNRYAYIGNSPVNGTDPSGWISVSSFLNERNINAIIDYTSNNYVNWWNTATKYPHFPNALVPNTESLQLADLDSAIQKLNQHLQLAEGQATKTFSGVPFSDENSSRLLSLKEGELYIDKRYVSTSWNKKVAVRYASVTDASKEASHESTGILLDIIGRSGADISGISSYSKEAELLYGRNTVFLCDSCEPRQIIGSTKYHYIKLREASVQKEIYNNPKQIITAKNRPLLEKSGTSEGFHKHGNSSFNNAVRMQYPHAKFNSWGILAKPLH